MSLRARASDIFGQLFDIGVDVLNVTVDAVTGIMTAQTGDAVKGIADASSTEIWQQWGFASIPSPPANGSNGAQCLKIKRGVVDIIFGGRDARAGQIWGNLKPGETCMFATGAAGAGQARVLLKQDGSVTLYTTDTNAVGGNAVFFCISPTNGLQFVSPWGKLTLGPHGFHVQAGSAAIDLVSLSGMPVGGSFFTVSSSFATLNSSTVLLGPQTSPAGYNPVSFGYAANPLTMPPVPIVSSAPGAPIGLFCSSSVFVAAP
jgi:hypothetical protein